MAIPLKIKRPLKQTLQRPFDFILMFDFADYAASCTGWLSITFIVACSARLGKWIA
jgi:hypothetical protein